ncbi:MAG: hypothetical protein ACTHNA_11695 [Sphingopyxis terrae]|uniref:hypothetical protein n=1 Tax=Sphingopyxis terrae TaxID=33052 RepID=UPI003F81C19B
MSDDNPIPAAMKSRGPEFLIANDIPRVWTTGAQAFINKDHALLIFREQNLLNDPETGQVDVVLKNVASLVMPTEVAIQLHALLGEQLAPHADKEDE